MSSSRLLSKLTIVAATAGLILLGAAADAAKPCDPPCGAGGPPRAARRGGPDTCAGPAAECCGMHRGRGARGAVAGRGAFADRDTIHNLLDNHDAIQRTVKEIDGGVETTTTSDDPEVVETLRRHVRQMQQRMESGQGLRHWDPLFAELFRRHDEVRMEIEDVPGGVLVRETADDADVVALIRQHAQRGVSEFVAGGYDRAHEVTPLPEGYAVAETESTDEDWRPPCMR